MSASEFLPYGRQHIDEDDIQAVLQVLRSDFLTTGPAVDEFEARLADAVDAPFAVVCSSGTAALHLACLALEAGPNDTGIVPAITFVATANALRYCDAEVCFVDV
jgi:dTDP-4-amino-4,6-dideoxygalactose transaminase